jgi:DNA/RNA endonuclease YhcR with UshA esterase domain
MRTLILNVFLTLSAASASAQTITPSEARSHIGEHVTVEGIVSEVHHAASGRATFINMGGRYPNHLSNGVIFERDAPKFPGVDSLQGKSVGITGTIKVYNQMPEIILNDAEQIKVK